MTALHSPHDFLHGDEDIDFPAVVEAVEADEFDTAVAIADLADWLGQQTWSDFAQSLADFYAKRGFLSEKQVAAGNKMRAKIKANEAKKFAAKAAPKVTPVTEAGMYRDPADDTIYKVQKAVHGSGNLYAKRLIKLDEPVVKGSKIKTYDFVFAAGVIRTLDAAWKMTLDEAKEWGALYGSCVRCGATLTDEKSITAGVGPVCAKAWS